MKNRIREVRKQVNLSQTVFGAKIGVTLGVIKNFEQGKTTLDSPLLELLCSIYNVNETWLRTGEGEMFNTIKTHTDLLPNTHNLSPRAALIMQNFLELSKSEQDKFVELAEKIFKEEKDYKQNKTTLEVASIEIGKKAADSGVTEKVSFHIDEEN